MRPSSPLDTSVSGSCFIASHALLSSTPALYQDKTNQQSKQKMKTRMVHD